MTTMTDRCVELHKVLECLPLIKYPFDISKMPRTGIYFFYEDGESWGHGGEKPRIVRVGTHYNNNFCSRILDHYIPDSKMNFDIHKPPPHDRSVFRKNIGRAILNRECNPYLEVWDIDFTTRKKRNEQSHRRNIDEEKRVETEVTKMLREKFSFRFIMMENERDRIGNEGIEAKIIGTLARCSQCNRSTGWLGRHSPKYEIRDSGLWLVQHLESEGLTEWDMERLSKSTKETERWVDKSNKTRQEKLHF